MWWSDFRTVLRLGQIVYMTSFMISAFVDRKLPDKWIDDECTFCKIITRKLPAYILFENDEVIVFLGML
jgi:hypothetical protein